MATQSWSARQHRARDAAWQAMYSFNVDPVSFDRTTPPFFEGLAAVVATAIIEPIDAVITRMGVRLDDEARIRVLTAAITSIVGHSPYSIADAIGDELARPDPQPFSPPPAGSWIRCRRLAGTDPRWVGMWHVYSGDFRITDEQTQHVGGRARCGAKLTLRWTLPYEEEPSHDFVVADDVPGVDACRRCAKSVAGA